jgi:hypothetical protein
MSNLDLFELVEPKGFSPEMAASTDERFNEAFERIRDLEGRPAQTAPPPSSQESLLKQNAYWVFPVLTLTLGSGFIFSFFHWFFADLVEHQIDAKLTESKLIGPNNDIQAINIEVRENTTKLNMLIDLLKPQISQRLRNAASLSPEQFQKELPQVKAAVALAKQEQLREPEETINSLGKQAIDLANVQSDIRNVAWQTATEILNYRSFLNVPPREALAIAPLPGNQAWQYGVLGTPGKPLPSFAFTEVLGVPSRMAARFDRIGEDKNQALQRGPLYLIGTGGATILDNMFLRNVVFQNVEIHYSGAQIDLKNVTFVNCTFVIDNNLPGRELGNKMLASNSVSFKNGD